MAKTLFVIGTGTDVGKTYVTGLIVKKITRTRQESGLLQGGNERKRAGCTGQSDTG